MIVVAMEMHPKGRSVGKYPLGIIVITNDGKGTAELGNYNYTISHAGKYFGKRKEPYKKGSIKGFPRAHSPYRLLQRVLKDARET